MSFMFNPYPYDDPHAYNRLDTAGLKLSEAIAGSPAAAAAAGMRAAEIAEEKGRCVIAVDGYSAVPIDVFCNLMEQYFHLQMIPAVSVETESLWIGAGEAENMLAGNLPEDREKDPVLLYGKLYEGTYEDFFDGTKLSGAVERIEEFKKSGSGVLIIWGYGALCDTLRRFCDLKIYLDATPKETMLRLKRGTYRNIGAVYAMGFKQMARRCYYVDFELAAKLRFRLLREKQLDGYVIADDPEEMTWLPFELVESIFSRAMEYPLRCKPVYLEGVWGGYYVQKLRSLPKEMKNCAWVFDMIPMEVSIVLELAERRFEFPFYTMVQSQGEKLMGKRSVDTFGYYFPVRFNYDDTYHSNGNMSIQCHPDADYVTANNGELGRQDESYYIVEAGPGARTYLGFKEDADVEEFVAETRRSEKDGRPVDYENYIYSVESKPGIQVMIPAGTIHASGRNQVILEIGSLTVGSYTYKMYDYVRKDLDGNPRPIHTYHGDRVLKRGHKGRWVEENLINGGKRSVRKGEDWEEFVVGEHELLYFSLRNERFVREIVDDTRGDFHVLALVDGEQVKICSRTNPDHFFLQNYMDIVVIPADFGPYEIINMKPGTTCIEHKTMLKERTENTKDRGAE